MGGTAPTILDGARMAAAREPGLATRSAATRDRNGRPPCLAVLAFGPPDSPPPWAELKRRAAEAVGVTVRAVALTPADPPRAFEDALAGIIADPDIDGIFVQYPLPAGHRAAGAVASVPVERDVDVMTAAAWRRFETGTGPPPATVEAACALLDAHGVELGGRSARVIGAEGALCRAFEIAFERRGVRLLPRTSAHAAGLQRAVSEAEILVALAERPGAIRAEWLAAGAVAIDGGYFNPTGRGDIDVSGDIAHLSAVLPVPGGLGPMTVSVLIERTIAAAAR